MYYDSVKSSSPCNRSQHWILHGGEPLARGAKATRTLSPRCVTSNWSFCCGYCLLILLTTITPNSVLPKQEELMHVQIAPVCKIIFLRPFYIRMCLNNHRRSFRTKPSMSRLCNSLVVVIAEHTTPLSLPNLQPPRSTYSRATIQALPRMSREGMP